MMRQPARRRFSFPQALFLWTLVAAGCGKGGEESVTPPVAVASIHVAPSTLRLGVGTRDTLVATVRDTDGQIVETAVVWASSNPAVASVAGFGTRAIVTAVVPGIASVSATANGRTAEVVVSVTLQQQLTVLYEGSGQGVVSSSPDGLVCTSQSCTGFFDYGSSVSLHATPAAASVLTAWGAPCAGKAVCTVVMDQRLTVTATFEVYPRPVAGVVVSPLLLELDEGGKGILTATVRDPEGNLLTDRIISWTSDSLVIATVSQAGEVMGHAEGYTFVTATSEGQQSSAKVVVQSKYFRALNMSAGGDHTCAFRIFGGMHCWGNPGSGRLGNPANPGGGLRVPVINGPSFPFADPGATHTCAVSAAAIAFCWGSGDDGELGDGALNGSAFPVRVAGGFTYFRIATGHAQSCGVATNGLLYCWGKNAFGTLGVGSNAVTVSVPAVVGVGLRATKVQLGRDHICAIDAQSTLYCWGRNDSGQLGTGDTGIRTAPALSQLPAKATDVSAGHDHTCAIDNQYALWCWGRNDEGQLGDGTHTTRTAPVRVQSPHGFIQVSAGKGHTCARTTSSDTYCWGENSQGQLGNGNNTSSNVPVKAAGPPLVWMAAGTNHTCGMSMTYEVYCWGSNASGQLGQTSIGSSNVPVVVPRP